MKPDTVLVTSYVVQALLGATYGAAFWGFWRFYGQRYLRDYAYAWAVFAAYAAAAGSAYWLAQVASESAERAYASMLSIALGLTFSLLLLRGVRGATGRSRLSAHMMGRLIVATTIVAVVVVLLTSPQAVGRSIRLLARVLAPTAVMGCISIHAGRLAWLAGAAQEWFGLRLLGGALMAFGIKEALGGVLLWFTGTATVIFPTLTVIDAIMVPIVGSAMAVSLLVIERARARASAEEAGRAQATLRDSEARFRSIIDGASDIVLTVTATGAIEFVGPSVTRVLGWPVDALVGRAVVDLVHPDDAKHALAALTRLLAGDADVAAIHVRLRAADNAWRKFEVLGNLQASSGGASLVVINARDLSERSEFEARLLQAQKLESIGQLAGGVAHDFNNILTAILGHVSMARLTVPHDAQLHGELDDIQRSAERAAELTRQLLAFARRQVIEPVILDLNERVEGMRRLLSRVIGEHIALGTELAPALWPVRADPSQLEQAIVNLALNARDAMPEGGRLLLTTTNVNVSASEAQAHGLSASGAFVRLVVQDSGAGMDEATRARIFEPFYTTKGSTGGTGLGLAMVHGVVAQSGGGVTVFSAPGAGARFSILLPRYAGPTQPVAVAVTPRILTPDRSATILLVEDEPQVRAVAARVLRGAGYTVIEAANGTDGVAKADGMLGRIDLVLSDLVMPTLSGPAMWQSIKARRPEARIVFMSGFSADTLPDGGRVPTEAGFLEKPFSVEALLAKVREALRLG